MVDVSLVLSASDLTGYLACAHLTSLEMAAVRGDRSRPERIDPELDVITARGVAHELAYLDHLKHQGSVSEISAEATLSERVEATRGAMVAGEPAIYQAVFFDGRWVGYADFLLRTERPTALGAWGYEVQDTKLARRVKPAALLQMCLYSDLLATVQEVEPELVHVVLGDMRVESFPIASVSAYYRSVRRRLEEHLDQMPSTYPEPVAHCGICRWLEGCQSQRVSDDYLSLVGGIGRSQARKLQRAGIATVTTLAGTPETMRVDRMGQASVARLRSQAALQLRGRESGVVSYELLELEGPNRGLASLPAPSTGDLFFDIEGDPFVEAEGLEYLFGLTELVDGEPQYGSFWAHDREEESAAFEALMDVIMARLEAHPDMHVYHYAPYESTALKRLMGRYDTRHDDVDRLLRGGVLIDLHAVVRQGLRVSQDSYSLKKLEPLYLSGRSSAILDAGSSIVAYERWLETQDEGILRSLEDYNADDCLSTLRLRDWLEARRLEASSQFGMEVPRPDPMDPGPPARQADADAETASLRAALTSGIAADGAVLTPEERARVLLGDLLGWHRREDRPAWWAYFHRLGMSEEELVDDPDSIGNLEYEGEVGRVKRSALYRYRFDPSQEHKLGIGDRAIDPQTRKPAGVIEDLDNRDGTLVLKRGIASDVPHPKSLIPATPIETQVLRGALARVARSVLEHGLDVNGPYGAVCELLLGVAPTVAGSRDVPIRVAGESGVEAACRAVIDLRGCLPIQGPPGSGKTFAGARMILDLVGYGRRVGICATSHRAICGLLDATVEACQEAGIRPRIMQKAGGSDASESPLVQATESNDELEAALANGDVDVVAGTQWLFAREGLLGTVDTLFIDEAGQMSLANVVAIAGAAKRIVLLGDPNQLAHPSKGMHPARAEASALEHLLGDALTVSPERGVFLETSYRLHPQICEFISDVFYEGRLVPDVSCASQRFGEADDLECGLQIRAVDHSGNRAAATEEAKVVAEIVDSLIGSAWTSRDGSSRRIGLDDILIVAPYNAHVSRLLAYLPEGAQVGTVDRFQGQEAPVVIYSMASSTVEDAPRGIEFLFSLNRLNVAVSRAQGLAIVVYSRRLLDVNCNTPRHMQLVNALCQFVEHAGIGKNVALTTGTT